LPWREVASQEGQCVAGAVYPSCLTVLFDRDGEPRIQSAAAVRAAAPAGSREETTLPAA
jgi:hypothetical protein